MTRQTLAKFLAERKLAHEERRLSKAIEIEVFAPEGFHFADGPHSRVFHWLSGSMVGLRAQVVWELCLPSASELQTCTDECDD